MSGKLTALFACLFAGIVILSGLPLGTAGAEEAYQDDEEEILLVTGTAGEDYPEHTGDWEQGDFVGLRFKNDAWFVVLYGTEEDPNAISLMSMYLRYLGGATVIDAGTGNELISEMGIPVLTVFGQKLVTFIEFQDVGYTEKNMFFEDSEPVGAHNDLWDVKRTGTEISDLEFTNMEPPIKALNLNTSWERSDIEQLTDKDDFYDPDNDHEWKFSLTATDLEYGDEHGNVWDPDYVNDDTGDTSVEKIQFTFHIGATKDKVTINGIPWYEVEVDRSQKNEEGEEQWKFTSSKRAGTEKYEGTQIEANFKYDHYIKGWDYKNTSIDTHLMLESFSFFGTFVPDIVDDWMDDQLKGDIENNHGTATYSTPTGDREVDAPDEVPAGAQLVTKERISFNDDWQRLGELTWVSNVTADGDEDAKMYYQIHASQEFFKHRFKKSDQGEASGILLMGGYIYPPSDELFHDPGFLVVVGIPDFETLINILDPGSAGCQLLAAMVIAVVAVGFGFYRRKKTAREQAEARDPRDGPETREPRRPRRDGPPPPPDQYPPEHRGGPREL